MADGKSPRLNMFKESFFDKQERGLFVVSYLY